jgi:hypothetical protein
MIGFAYAPNEIKQGITTGRVVPVGVSGWYTLTEAKRNGFKVVALPGCCNVVAVQLQAVPALSP